MVEMVLEEYGADPTATDADGNTTLHWAAWYECADIVNYLCEHENKRQVPDVRNAKGQTALHWAAMSGVIKVIEPLLKLGADITLVDNDGFGVAHCAAQHAKTAALDFLQIRGAVPTLTIPTLTP